MPIPIKEFSFFSTYGLKSALFTLIALWVLIPLAHRLKLIDHPTGRKNHGVPTPLIGGISMLIGLSGLLLIDLHLVSFWLLATAILLVGVIDDRHDLKARTRLLIHSLIILLAIFFSPMRLDDLGCIFSSSPFYLDKLGPLITLFLVLSFMNSINMLDGMDGLVASIVAGQALFLLGFSLVMHEHIMALLLTNLLFVLGVFLFYNLPNRWHTHARVFLGDAGSTLLAFFITWIVIGLSQNASAVSITPITLFWCVFFPFMEIYSACSLKRSKGKALTAASHDHIHFLLAKKGFSKKTTVLLLFTLSSSYGLLGLVLFWMQIPENIQFLMMWINIFAYASLVKRLDNSVNDATLQGQLHNAVEL